MRHHSEENRLKLRHTFDLVADLYDRARPTYPPQLFDDLFSAVRAGAESNVLEVGCGPGQASTSLAERCKSLTCIELGTNMTEVARRNLTEYPHATIINAPFEDWDAKGSQFDIVFASSAWHWIDPIVRYSKAANLLHSDGMLAIVTNRHAFPEGYDAVYDDIQKLYVEICGSEREWPPPQPEAIVDSSEDILSSGLFDKVEVKRYLWSQEYSAKEYTELLDTYSDHRTMEDELRARLFAGVQDLIDARPTQRIHKHFLTMLHLARPLHIGG